MITYVNTVPIDEHRAINRFCLIRNFATSPVFDSYTRKVGVGRGRGVRQVVLTGVGCGVWAYGCGLLSRCRPH